MNDLHTSNIKPPRPTRRSTLIFILVLIASMAGAAYYVTRYVDHQKAASAMAPTVLTVPLHSLPASPQPTTASAPAELPREPVPEATSDALMPPPATQPGTRPFMLFRSTALGDSYGRMSKAFPGKPDGPRQVSRLQCERVHFAAGRGICLEAQRWSVATYRAQVFDDKLTVRHTLPLAGAPSRARMSPDGRLAAFTVFVNGHSYASPGFTTRTSIVNTDTGQFVVDDLETMTVVRNGELFRAADFNFWGVTFRRDGQRFFATLGTAGKTLLVEGNLSSRQMQVLQEGVECPSLSPDESKLAFKRRMPTGEPGRFIWRLHVLELATGNVTPLTAETRNVDDQVEWLDLRHVVYGLPGDVAKSSAETNVWSLAVDAATPPKMLMRFAESPAVGRSL